MIADVLVEVRARTIDQTFSYVIPSNLKDKIKVGIRVLVPFGSRNVEGFVLNIKNESSLELKSIADVIDNEPVLNKEMLDLGLFLQKRTLATLISCYQTMLPKALKAKKGCKINEKYITYIRLIDKNYIT